MDTNQTNQALEPTIDQHNTLSPSDHAQAIAHIHAMRAKGTLTPDQANHVFDELAVPHAQRQPDTRSDDVKLLDQHFPPAKPEEFSAVRFHLANEDPTPEQRQSSTITRTWLSEAGFSRDLGNTVFRIARETATKLQRMTDAEHAEWSKTQNDRLRRVYGDSLDAKLAQAGQMVHLIELKHPGLKQLLRQIGDSSILASLLIQQSDRYFARRKG